LVCGNLSYMGRYMVPPVRRGGNVAKVNFAASRVARFSCPDGKAQAFLWDAAAAGLGLR